MTRSTILSAPNLLTMLRFPLAAAFLLFDNTGARVAVIGVASATDVLDGWLARRHGRHSRLGALLDPVADKTFVLAALSVFIIGGKLTITDALIVLSRDLATAVGFAVAYWMPSLDPASFKARWAGKAVSMLQIAILLSLLIAPGLVGWLVPAIGVASAVAIADYTLALAREHRAAAR